MQGISVFFITEMCYACKTAHKEHFSVQIHLVLLTTTTGSHKNQQRFLGPLK